MESEINGRLVASSLPKHDKNPKLTSKMKKCRISLI
jgi:hypothetical protein